MKEMRVCQKIDTPSFSYRFLSFVISYYLTSSKINSIVYQTDKYSMVQMWTLKYIKSILEVIICYYI